MEYFLPYQQTSCHSHQLFQPYKFEILNPENARKEQSLQSNSYQAAATLYGDRGTRDVKN